MPIYEYQCQGCAHRLTARQGINDARLATCPDCGGESLQRLISQTSFVLKGSGWYASDYKSPAPAESAGTETSTSSETSTGGSETSTSGSDSSGGTADAPGASTTDD